MPLGFWNRGGVVGFSNSHSKSTWYSRKKMLPILISVLLTTVSAYTDYNHCNSSVVAPWLVPPVFTALNDDQTINYDIVPSYARFLVNNGIKSVLVGGTTGEHPTRNVEERKRYIDAWVRAGKSLGMYIIAQVGGAPYREVKALAKYCSTAGVDAIMTLPELYYQPTTVDDLVSYVGLVAKYAPNLPVLYYHFPAYTNVEIDMEEFVPAATARIPNFKGVKFSSGDLSEAARVQRTLRKDQEMFFAADTLLGPARLLGIRSYIGAYFNIFPRLVHDIFEAVDRCDVTEAGQLQEKLSLAIEAIEAEADPMPPIPAMKAAMEMVNGIKVGPPSLPMMPISVAGRKRIAAKLRRLGLCDYD